MEFNLTIDDKNPLYKQIYDQIKSNIINKKVEEGALLPSIRNLSKELDLSVITIKRAYIELERDGYICTRQGKGSYVSTIDLEKEFKNNKKTTEHKLKKIIMESKSMGLKNEDIKDIMEKILMNRNSNAKKVVNKAS